MTPEEQKKLEEEAKAALDAKKQADAAAQTPPQQPPAAPAPPPDDPLLLEYAALLKSQLGNLHDPEYDKLPLKERIATLKIVKATMDKMPSRGEGKPPIGPGLPTANKPSTPLERYEKQSNPLTTPRLTSAFGITKSKGV